MLHLAILASLLVFAQHQETPGPSADDLANEARHLTNVRQVTSSFARAGEGYFNPDGNRIILQAVSNSPPAVFYTPLPNQDEYQIFVSELAKDARPKMVSTGKGACTCGYFHPDGKSILYASSHLDPTPSGPRSKPYSRTERYKWEFPRGMDIFRANLDGTSLVRLTDTPGYDAEGSYSPDGKQIVFCSFRSGDPEIWIMDADGKNPRQITKAKGYDGGPFFSPDGKRIVYRSDRKDNDLLQIYLNNTEGTAERALTNNEFVNWGPYWHPDAKHIIYATSRHGHQNYELYLMDVHSGQEERITYHDGFDGLPAFSADGKRLMWTSSGRTADRKSQLFIGDFRLQGGAVR
jgi:Tol biopolymer transport system component